MKCSSGIIILSFRFLRSIKLFENLFPFCALVLIFFNSQFAFSSINSRLYCRFLATDESNAHPTYKRKLLELEETEYTDVFGRARWPGAPQRVLKTPFFAQLTTLPSDENETNQPIIGHSTIHDMVKTSTLVPHHVENVLVFLFKIFFLILFPESI